MNISVSLDKNYSLIYREITKILIEEINIILVKAIRRLKPKVAKLIEDSLLGTPEVQSLMGGQLQAELGVPDAESRIRRIISTFASGVKINLRPMARRGLIISGGFDLLAIKSDYGEGFSLSDSYYTTEKGQTIQWLEWLLTMGDKTIIKEYTLNTDIFNTSRTGLGKIMMKSQRGSWRVPPQFAGTEDNNFITRGLDTMDAQLEALIVGEF